MKKKIVGILVVTLLITLVSLPVISGINIGKNNLQMNKNMKNTIGIDSDTTIDLKHTLIINPTNKDQKIQSMKIAVDWHLSHRMSDCLWQAYTKADIDYIRKWGLDGPPSIGGFDPINDILVFKYGNIFEDGGYMIDLINQEVDIEQIARYYHNNELVGTMISNTYMNKTGEAKYLAQMTSTYEGTYPPCPVVSLDVWEDYLKEVTRSLVLYPLEPGYVEGSCSYYVDFVDLRVTTDTQYRFDTEEMLPTDEIYISDVETIDIDLDEVEISMTISDYIDPALHVKEFKGGFGVKVIIENLGLDDAEDIEVTIHIDAPLMFIGQETKQTISIEAGESYGIGSGFFFGIGPATITATIFEPRPQPALEVSWKTEGLIIGPFGFNVEPYPQPA